MAKGKKQYVQVQRGGIRMGSGDGNPLFNNVEMSVPNSNRFELNHSVKMSANIGQLYPCLIMDCLPGDKVKIDMEALIRMAPMIAPIMDKIEVYIHVFFVPNRIVYPDWEKFITGEEILVHPYLDISDTMPDQYKKFLDYFGIPPIYGGGTPTRINPLALAAYQKVWNDYYRDQNLIEEVEISLVSGANNLVRLLTPRFRALEHDYFTSNLPFAQKGAPVEMEATISDNAEVKMDNNNPFRNILGIADGGDPADPSTFNSTPLTVGNDPDLEGKIYAATRGLSVTAITINELRQANALQRWLERNARGGTRYTEHIKAHFGVEAQDMRLQRPEYITGLKQPIVVSEVLNTSGTFDPADPTMPSSPPQGSMAGHGVSVAAVNTEGYYKVYEHGYIIGMLSILPRTSYYQGIPRHFNRTEPTDYYFPDFANIGEQEVLNKELFAYAPEQEQVFGYLPRYAEYRTIPSRIAGDFRNSLEYWHLARKFYSTPQLNQTFIEAKPEQFNRIFAVQDNTDKFYIHLYNKVDAIRLMPKYGTPML